MVRIIFKLGYLLSFIIFPLLVMELASQRLSNIPLRLIIFGLLSLCGAWLYRIAWHQHRWSVALLLTILGYGVAYKLASFIPDVSNFPFSLSWSEASRYYYASLWFSRQIYGVSLPPSVLHPSRYLLQSIPFIIPETSLLFHRLWQVILWIVTASLTSWLLLRRISPNHKKIFTVMRLCLFSWAFLFLFQGPVYYHLLFMVILLLWGFNRNSFWRTLILVIVVSLWAGISRINWLPVPGFLVASLYLLETPLQGKSLWRFLLPPSIWVIAGTGVAYTAQQTYELISGNPPVWFGSSFSSDLLWYRLLPNPTFPLGILPSAILVSLPLIGLMVFHLNRQWRNYHPVRILGLIALLFILFSGGVVVSVKIGGGSNLHNLDAYLTLLLVIGSYICISRFVPDYPDSASIDQEDGISTASRGKIQAIESVLLILAVVIPLYFSLTTGGAVPHRDFPTAQAAVQIINSATREAASRGGEVLFINQRHLLTFEYIQGVALVPEYELVFLMEMAMSNNSAYLDAFYTDLSSQRFSMIVSEPLQAQYQGRSHSFGEENDAWVERVSESVLCYYEAGQQIDAAGVILYTPRAAPCK
jgi:hypothetical protein